MSSDSHEVAEVHSSPSSPSSPHNDSSTYAIEQESAKLQAEVHKLSQELEDLMSSRHVSEGRTIEEGYVRYEVVGETAQEGSDQENSFSPSKIMRKSRFSPLSTSNPLLEEREDAVNSLDKDARGGVPSPTFSNTPKGLLFTPEPGQSTSFLSESRGKTSLAISGWKRVNSLLADCGFPQVSIRVMTNGEFIADSDSSCEVLSQLLNEIAKTRRLEAELEVNSTQKRGKSLRSESETLREDLKRVRVKWEEERGLRQDERFEMDRRVRELEREIAGIRGRLETAQMQLKQRDQLISELKSQQSTDPPSPKPDIPQSTDRDRVIFVNYFSREPKTITDAKILGLIHAYEEMRKRAFLDSRNPSLQQDPLKPVMKRQSQPIGSEVVSHVLGLLELASEDQLVSAVQKMLQVIRALPSLEQFIKAISAEVVDFRVGGNQAIDEVLPTIRVWKAKATQWEELNTMKKELCQALKIEGKCDTGEIVSAIQLMRVRETCKDSGNAYFRKLFQIHDSEDIKPAMNQVFLFVHEMKTLLHVHPTQSARESLSLGPSTPVQTLIDTIKHKLQQ